MERHTIEIMGSQLAYWEQNPAGRRTVVMVHGFRGNHKGLLPLAEQLADYRLIMLDLPGYGESTPMRGRHTMQRYALALEEFCAQLGLHDFDVVAHSFGATIALISAARHKRPPRRLVVIAPAVPSRGFFARLTASYYQAALLLPQDWRRFWLAHPLFPVIAGEFLIHTHDRELRRALFAAEVANLAEFRPDVAVQGFASFARLHLSRQLRRVAVPTLVVAARHDRLVPLATLEAMARELPNGKLVVVEDAGHLLVSERPSQVAAAIRTTLG